MKKEDIEWEEGVVSPYHWTQESAKKDGVWYLRKKGAEIYYTSMNDNDWNCVKCSADVQGAQVAHPIHDGPFALSGPGRVHYDIVPYCPMCEDKPSFNGGAITPPGAGRFR